MDEVFAAIARAVFERYLGTVVDGYIYRRIQTAKEFLLTEVNSRGMNPAMLNSTCEHEWRDAPWQYRSSTLSDIRILHCTKCLISNHFHMADLDSIGVILEGVEAHILSTERK